MKKNLKKLFLIALIMFVGKFAFSQFTVSAEFRTRGEANKGYKFLPVSGDDIAFYVSQRSRINFDFKKDNIQVYMSLQDVRTWGGDDLASKTGVWSNTASTGIYQAWAKWMFSESSALKIGRQEWKYDDQRLLSWRDWNQYGLTYDAITYMYKKDGWGFDLGLSLNNYDDRLLGPAPGAGFGSNDYIDDGFRFKTINFLYLSKKLNEKSHLSFIGIASGRMKPGAPGTLYMMGTFGPHLTYKSGMFDVVANFYYQMGKNATGVDKAAWMGSLNMGVKAGMFRIGAGVDALSGNDNTNTNRDKDNAFDLLYGARFKYNGWMNYFLLDSWHQGTGLLDIYPNITANFNKRNMLTAYFHVFSMMGKAVKSDGTEFDKGFGQELDLMYVYKYNKDINVKAGFCMMMPSETMESLHSPKPGAGNSETPFWGFLQLTIKPTLFTSGE